jgi:predicted RNA-binding Zn-ribbon protein involved in translation (DUF1610 family)
MPARDHPIASSQPTKPPCPRCGQRMILTNVEPQAPDYEIRNFECASCGYAVGDLVKNPPREP